MASATEAIAWRLVAEACRTEQDLEAKVSEATKLCTVDQQHLALTAARFAWDARWASRRQLLSRRVDEVLSLSTRARNCLKAERVVYLGHLVVCSTEADLLRSPNLGSGTLRELREKLRELGLFIGMENQCGWTPPSAAEVAA